MVDVIFYGLLAAFGNILGSIIPLLKKNISKKSLYKLMAFGSGILLGVAFMHILPEAMQIDAKLTAFGLTASFLLIFLLEHFVLVHSCPDSLEECPLQVVGTIAFLAILFHSIIDGIAITAGTKLSSKLGFIISFVVLIHKLPDGLTTSSILLASGYSRKKTLLFSLIVAFATPIAAIFSYMFVSSAIKPLTFLLGFSAGAFIYVGAADLLPRLHKEKDLLCNMYFVLGLVIMFIFSFWV